MSFLNLFKKKRVKVGYIINPMKGGVVWYPPEIIDPSAVNPAFLNTTIGHDLANSVARYFLIRCPFDINVNFIYNKEKKNWALKVNTGNNFSINNSALRNFLHITPADQWRHPERPLIQISTQYRFLSDEKVYISQLPPFTHFLHNQWPGVFMAGRFPIDVWPRTFMWAIEIHDLEKPLILRRGDPWFIARFESTDPKGVIEVVEAETNAQILEYFTQVDGVTSYVVQTFSLFKTGWERRPKKMLIERKNNK